MDLTAAEEALLENTREVAVTELRAAAREADRFASFPEENWDALAREGLTGLSVPSEFGGTDLDPREYAIVNEQVAYGSLAVATALSVHALATRCIVDHGGAAVRERWLPPMASGRPVGAFALSEPHAGSNPAALSTVARREGDGYRLDGQKQWITNGKRAGVFIVFARTNAGDSGTITQFLVPASEGGVTAGQPEDKLGLRASDTTPVEFDDVYLPAEYRLTPVGEGLKAAYQALNTGRIGIAAQSVGLAQAAFDETIDTGERLARTQTSRHQLAEMATRIEAARGLVWAAAHRRARGENIRKWASMAKLFASRMAVAVTSAAVQLHGEAGYLVINDVERFYRDAKVTEIYEGTTQIQRNIIADAIDRRRENRASREWR